MTRTITITLPYEVAHVIEIQAAKDDIRIEEGWSWIQQQPASKLVMPFGAERTMK